jgi:hypothetical protein
MASSPRRRNKLRSYDEATKSNKPEVTHSNRTKPLPGLTERLEYTYERRTAYVWCAVGLRVVCYKRRRALTGVGPAVCVQPSYMQKPLERRWEAERQAENKRMAVRLANADPLVPRVGSEKTDADAMAFQIKTAWEEARREKTISSFRGSLRRPEPPSMRKEGERTPRAPEASLSLRPPATHPETLEEMNLRQRIERENYEKAHAAAEEAARLAMARGEKIPSHLPVDGHKDDLSSQPQGCHAP